MRIRRSTAASRNTAGVLLDGMDPEEREAYLKLLRGARAGESFEMVEVAPAGTQFIAGPPNGRQVAQPDSRRGA